MKTCSVRGCDRHVVTRKLCNLHYSRLRRLGKVGSPLPRQIKPESILCSVEGCNKEVKAKGLCSMHHQRWFRNGDVGESEERKNKKILDSTFTLSKEFVTKKCNAIGCEENGIGMGFCEKHLNEYKKGNGFK